jgi:hypothetical protein
VPFFVVTFEKMPLGHLCGPHFFTTNKTHNNDKKKMKSTNSSAKNTKAILTTASATSSNSALSMNSVADFNVSAAVAIKLEPTENLSKFDEILKKRKADRLISTPSDTDCAGVAVTSNTSASAPHKKAKLSVLEEKVSSQMDSGGNAAVSSTSSFTTPPRATPQQKTVVQFNVYSVEGDAPGEEVPVAVTLCNIFGLKDIILGNKQMPNGDFFYWPARMLYPHQVAAVMDAQGNIHPSSAQFLQTSNGRPLIVLSRLSKVKDSLLTFDEVVDFLQPFIQGRTDESSNGTPKRTFDLNIIRRVLTEVELDALLAISAKISVKTAAV